MKKKIQAVNATDSLKLSLTAMASGAIWFYAGPIASVASRAFFTSAYDFLYGIPNWYNPSYGLAYMPIREHVANYAFEYGGFMLGSLCAPFIYKGVDSMSHLGEKFLTNIGLITVEQPKIKELIQPIPPLRFSKQNHRILKIKELEKQLKEEPSKFERKCYSAPTESSAHTQSRLSTTC